MSPHASNPRHFIVFFFNDTATTEIYTLSLHDALPIYLRRTSLAVRRSGNEDRPRSRAPLRDRKSTRLNSSHANISYAVFCLKKKNDSCCSWRGSQLWPSI